MEEQTFQTLEDANPERRESSAGNGIAPPQSLRMTLLSSMPEKYLVLDPFSSKRNHSNIHSAREGTGTDCGMKSQADQGGRENDGSLFPSLALHDGAQCCHGARCCKPQEITVRPFPQPCID